MFIAVTVFSVHVVVCVCACGGGGGKYIECVMIILRVKNGDKDNSLDASISETPL